MSDIVDDGIPEDVHDDAIEFLPSFFMVVFLSHVATQLNQEVCSSLWLAGAN